MRRKIYQPSNPEQAKLLNKSIEETYKNLPDDEKKQIDSQTKALITNMNNRLIKKHGYLPKRLSIGEAACREILVKIHIHKVKNEKPKLLDDIKFYWEEEDQ